MAGLQVIPEATIASVDPRLSERVLQRELQNPGIVGTLNLAERRRTQCPHRDIEVCAIQQIEKFETQLESLPFPNLEKASEVRIQVEVAGRDQAVVAGVAESA